MGEVCEKINGRGLGSMPQCLCKGDKRIVTRSLGLILLKKSQNAAMYPKNTGAKQHMQ